MTEHHESGTPIAWRVTWDYSSDRVSLRKKRTAALYCDFATRGDADHHKNNLKASYGTSVVVCTVPIFISNTPRRGASARARP